MTLRTPKEVFDLPWTCPRSPHEMVLVPLVLILGIVLVLVRHYIVVVRHLPVAMLEPLTPTNLLQGLLLQASHCTTKPTCLL